MQILSEQAWKKFQLLKIRMKISYMAFSKDLTIYELFVKAINDAYYQRKKQGLLRNPWPKMDLTVLKMILGVNNVEDAIVWDLEHQELDKCCDDIKMKGVAGDVPEEPLSRHPSEK